MTIVLNPIVSSIPGWTVVSSLVGQIFPREKMFSEGSVVDPDPSPDPILLLHVTDVRIQIRICY